MWSESEEEDEKNADKKEEKGGGEKINKNEYAAKSDKDDNDSEGENRDGKEKKEKKEINEMEEPEDNGDQIDPYHGNHPPEPEPEPLDLPEDMQLDEGDTKGDANEKEENPFDIDLMKEKQPPLEMEEDEKKENQNKNEKDKSDGSEEEEDSAETFKDEEMEVDEQDESDEDSKENSENENGNKRTEKNNEENLEKVDGNIQEEFHPSDDKPSVVPAQPAPDTNTHEPMSSDQVIGNEDKKPNAAQPQETSQNSEIEPKGTGQAEIEQMKQGHDSSASKKEKLNVGQSLMEKQRKRERPGKSDDNRCLGEAESVVNKKLKTLDILKEEVEEEDSKGKQDEESEIYQHISEKVQNASQVLDAATKEQAESQPIPNKEKEESSQAEEENFAMDVDEEEVEVEDVEKRKSEMDFIKNPGSKTEKEGESLNEDVIKQIEGELVQTKTAERAPETTFHTVMLALADQSTLPLRPEEIQALRLEINQQLLNLNKGKIPSYKQAEAWQLLTSVVNELARDLSEQLRLILEPTQATRLKGDYRTGKRINMRKVISYIASEFRKDRIWLRRTKPWKRDHEIVLAIDDSSSMSDNESKELAFESLALVFKALGFIEAGQLGVLSFGEKTKIVHKLGDPFTDENGLRLLEEITFEQKQTLVSEMLTVSTSMMTSEKKKGDVARLLLIISDGRGVFTEGLETVKTAVRRATDCGIFVVFLVIDNPKSKDSIMDIRVPEFKDGKLVGLQPYMELFPFPFYLILRDISALPNTLSDALRQWFELTTANSA